MLSVMSITDAFFDLVRPRAKVLAREHRKLRADLLRVRHENGLSQADVAELMDITPQAVSKLERYDADLKLSTLRRYANAVGALIEHTVECDRGQSIPLSAESPWGTAPTISEVRQLRTSSMPRERNAAPEMWAANSNRVDFALAS